MRARASSSRLAIATAADHPSLTPDDAPLLAELGQLGVESVVCVWNDASVDWSAFDAVLIRTIWDYYKHHAAFLAWLDRLDQRGVQTINDSALLRWNSDKRYLVELAKTGVTTIPTRVTGAQDLSSVVAASSARQVVIKPTVSGSAWQTLRGDIRDDAFMAEVAKLPHQLDYLVQPFVPEIVSAGEWSLLYFDGVFSHAVIKRPAAGDYRVQDEHGGSFASAVPNAAILQAAEQALAAVATLGHSKPAYVRVDGVVSGGRFLIMELEMIEPFLFLGMREGAANLLAREVVRRLLNSSMVGDPSTHRLSS